MPVVAVLACKCARTILLRASEQSFRSAHRSLRPMSAQSRHQHAQRCRVKPGQRCTPQLRPGRPVHSTRASTRNAQVTKSTFFTWERTSQWLPWMTMGERKGYIQCAPDLTHRGCGRTVASVRSIDAPQHRLTVLLAQQCALRATARRTKCAPVAR